VRPPILYGKKGIREGRWKLLLAGARLGFGADPGSAETTKLYNLDDDIAESNNLAPAHPERVEGLKKKIKMIMDQ